MTDIETISCRTCGEPFAYQRGPHGGRPPRHCEAHRKPRSSRGDVAAAKARAGEQARRRRLSDAAAKVAADDHQLARLAIELSVTADPARAARAIGAEVDHDGAEALARLARESHPMLAEPTDRAVIAREARRLTLLALREASARVTEIAPGMLANVIARAADVLSAADASDGAPKYATIELTVVGPDGQRSALDGSSVH